MSFVRLLLANRSLNTVKDEPSPYKMKQANLLPKFGSKKKDEESEAEPPVTSQAETVREFSNSADKPTPKVPRFARWLGFAKRFRRVPVGKRIPVQTELLLENVRVMRNDLQEMAHPGQPMRTQEAFVPKTSTVAGQWWLRLQLRLFQQRRKPG